MKTNKHILLASVVLSASAHAAVIVSESFGGLSSANLNGTVVTDTVGNTFASGITSAGGSATWVASADYKANGSVTTRRTTASLNLGSYVNDAKGTTTGKFILQATMNMPTIVGATDYWAALGFAGENAPATTKTFNNQGITGAPGTTTGYANMLYRTNGDIDQFAGAGTANQVALDDVLFSGVRTLSITLDFTPAGGYNTGASNFGTVYFGADTGIGDAYEEYGSFTYTSDAPIGSILLSVFGGIDATPTAETVTTTFGNLTLSQIPEPSAALLGGLGVLVLLRRRR